MIAQRPLAMAILGLLVVASAAAQSVYKSVDAQGRVSYSSLPPMDVPREMLERVPILAGPTEQQQQAAAQRARELEQATQRARGQMREREQAAARARDEARRHLQEVTTALQEARIRSDADWQYLSTGGRVLKQDYLDRVEDAERLVREAKRALSDVDSGRR